MSSKQNVVVAPGTGEVSFKDKTDTTSSSSSSSSDTSSSFYDNIIIENIGSGFGLYSKRDGNTFEFKSLVPGSGVLIVEGTDTLTLQVSGQYLPLSGGTLTGTLYLTEKNANTSLLSVVDTSNNTLTNLYYRDLDGLILTSGSGSSETTLFSISNTGGSFDVDIDVKTQDVGDSSNKIADTEFVTRGLDNLKSVLEEEFSGITGNYLPLDFTSDQTLTINGNKQIYKNTSDSNLSFELGLDEDTYNTYFNFQNNKGNAYDVRLIFSGGVTGSNGEGSLNIAAKNVYIQTPAVDDNSDQVASTKYVQENLGNYTTTADLSSNYLQKTDAASLYVPISNTSYTFATSPNTLTVDTTGITLNSSNVKITDLPTTDPGVAGVLWNDRGFVVISGQDTDYRANRNARMVAFATSAPTSNEVISLFVSDWNYTIPVGFDGTYGSVSDAPTASYTLTVNKNSVEIGTIVIGIDKSFTFNLSTATSISIGDVIELVAPETADSNIKNLVINFSFIGQ